MTRLLCTFRPQMWQRDNAYPVHFEDIEHSWEVDYEGDDLPDPFSYESDALRDDPAAPDWVRSWPGPFEVAYEVVMEASAGRPRPDFDPKIDYPERFTDGPI